MAQMAAVSAPVCALTAAVDTLLAQVPADLPEAQALADATALVAQLERLRSVVLTRVADVDTRSLHTHADAPSTGTWLAAQQTSRTRSELAVARRLAAFPTVAAAVDAGELSVAVAARVVAALVKARRHVDRPDGLIDGQPAEPTVQAVVVDGVLSLLCQARGGLADDDPLLHSLHTQLTAIAGSRRIETSHTERTLTPHERRIKRIETGGRCQGAGCRTRPGAPLVPHHSDPWVTSGTTSVRDTVMLCEQTHHDLHSGKTILLKDGRRLGPHGWVRGRAA